MVSTGNKPAVARFCMATPSLEATGAYRDFRLPARCEPGKEGGYGGRRR
jgi:hypothetical protein